MQDCFELLLRGRYVPALNDALLDPPLDYAPQRLDAVQFGTIWWHKHELKVQVLSKLSYIFCVVTRVIIENDEYLLVRICKRPAQLTQECHHVLLISGLPLHENWPIETGADGSIHSDSVPSKLWERPLD